MSDITPIPFATPFKASLRPPGSKSLTNRALVLAALARGQSTIRNILLADDTAVMLDSLDRLGVKIERDANGREVRIHGTGGKIPSDAAQLHCGNSGTTIRFLSAACALGRGEYVLDGIPRMRQRPILELGQMLQNLGVRVEYPLSPGFPPIRIKGDGLPGGRLFFGASQSSQYLSAVLQAAPFARHEVRIDLGRPQTSWPYVAMTMRLMDEFSVTPELLRDEQTREPECIIIPCEPYQGRIYDVEPDASNASYFLAAAAIREGASVTVEGLGKRSLQGDVGFADLLHQMGADLVFGPDFITVTGTGQLHGIDVSLADMPDMAQTLAVTSLFAQEPTTLRGLHTLRVKETDRIAALATELIKLGATVRLDGDDLTIHPPATLKEARIHTYDDHRMAMSFAVAATRAAGITLCDRECVNKTYPGFFEDLARLQG